MNKVILGLLTLALFQASAFAKVTVKAVDFKKSAHRGHITISYDGVLRGEPELLITGKSIQVVIPNSKVKRAIEKSVSFSSKLKDTNLKAYQTTKNSSKVKASFAFNMQKKKDLVNLTFRDNKLVLSFPRKAVALKKTPKYSSIVKKKKKVKKEFLNEDYLNKLLTVKKPTKAEKAKTKKDLDQKATDIVNMAQAASTKTAPNNSKPSINMVEYAGKFVAFLGVVLLLFYGVITLMKKGFIKKGKLGFLNNTDQVSVISTTHIAPKKSLMLIKAHNQVFLVSNTDAGIHPISEIKDPAGLFKEGEKTISGTNFDTRLSLADADGDIESKIKIKEDIMLSNQNSSKSSYGAVKDKVKFSDQLKKKVKDLKPLQ